MTKKQFTEKFDDYSHLLDFDEQENAFIIKPTLHGDYTGSLVERSNYDEIMVGKYIWIKNLSWSYSSHAIEINFGHISKNSASEITEILEQLDKYPLLNEDRHSELQINLIQEAISDFKKSHPEYFYSNDFDTKAYEYLSEKTPYAYFIDFSESDFVERMLQEDAIQERQEKSDLPEIIEKFLEKNTVNQFYSILSATLSIHDFEELKDLMSK